MSRPVGVTPQLAELARRCGVATSYRDQQGRRVQVGAPAVIGVLGLLGVAAQTPEAVAAALDEQRRRPWRRAAPPAVVQAPGAEGSVPLHAAAEEAPTAWVQREDGARHDAVTVRGSGAVRELDGDRLAGYQAHLPPLPVGWHTLHVADRGRETRTALLVPPDRLQLPPELGRAWGWMVQLYALRSSRSWGMGDLADLATVAGASGAAGAGFLLCNPLHAGAPTLPVTDSPYFPSSRRFTSPLYLRVEDTPEYAAAPPPLRARVDAIAAEANGDNGGALIDRDRVWARKREALTLLWQVPGRREAELQAFRDREGAVLDGFATWCALADRYGADWRSWPAELRAPSSPSVARTGAELADEVAFHAWLQLLCTEQLAAAQRRARDAGMPVGIIHDLAVGSDPGGADAWWWQDVLAGGARVGAPPDGFNQRGQDWGLPPWHPQRLADAGYAPLRELLRGLLRHAGGVRIDHILGMFRLWWVPEGASPADGTYVSYDAEALLAVLLLEARRAGALVVGEDLGTVEPAVQRALAQRGLLGSSVLYFERDVDPETGADHGRLPLRRWRELALASVTTHDLPTAAGFLAGEHVRVRAELGQLTRSPAEEAAAAARERGELVDQLVGEGLVAPGADDAAVVTAMHQALVRTPARLVGLSAGDAVGDRRQPNLPGTTDEYPNWRLPVTTGEGEVLTLDAWLDHPGVRELAQNVDAALKDTGRSCRNTP